MYDEIVARNPSMLDYMPDEFKTKEIYIKALELDPMSAAVCL